MPLSTSSRSSGQRCAMLSTPASETPRQPRGRSAAAGPPRRGRGPSRSPRAAAAAASNALDGQGRLQEKIKENQIDRHEKGAVASASAVAVHAAGSGRRSRSDATAPVAL